ncbi:SH3 domain-containing protein [Streptomyces ossamyceticus]
MTLVGTVFSPSAAAAPARPDAPSAAARTSVVVPVGVTAGVAVYDRQAGTFTEQLNPSMQFRSASIVKLLMVLDYFWNRDPGSPVPAADRAWLEPMLRSSDDDAANDYWSNHGYTSIVTRMRRNLELSDTEPPANPDFWGYTAMSARDTVTVYRYILEKAPASVRTFIMDNLRQSTRCASDRFDQHFGIAGAFNRPWAVKQGWSGSSYPEGTCGPASTVSAGTAAEVDPVAEADPVAAAVDLTHPVLHSTGTVGTGDRSIVAVFTQHEAGTSYGKAYTDVGRLTRSLNVPGGVAPTGKWYGTWSSQVAVRSEPRIGNNVLTRLPAGVEVLVGCQKKGQTVSVPPYTNDWWAYLPQYGGYISNIYISHPDNQLPDVRLC